MTASKVSKSERVEALATGAAITALAVSHFLKFYCEGKKDELVCINEVEEPPHQRQTDPERMFSYQNPYIVRSATTASGNASVSPSESPSPSPSPAPPSTS